MNISMIKLQTIVRTFVPGIPQADYAALVG